MTTPDKPFLTWCRDNWPILIFAALVLAFCAVIAHMEGFI